MESKTTSKILQNQYILKKYTDAKFTLTVLKNNIKPSGYEVDKPQKTKNKNSQKLENHLSRAKSKIYELAICNQWDYFVTITLDQKKYNRYDLEKYIKDLGQYIRDERKRTGKTIRYILIPELHADGAYHMHGLLSGVCEGDLQHFNKFKTVPKNIMKMLKQERDIYNWLPYACKFGFNTLEEVRNQEAIAKYITKYIGKDVGQAVTERNKKSYYRSRGLKEAETVKKGTFPTGMENALQDHLSYSNDYVVKYDLDGKEALQVLQGLLVGQL